MTNPTAADYINSLMQQFGKPVTAQEVTDHFEKETGENLDSVIILSVAGLVNYKIDEGGGTLTVKATDLGRMFLHPLTTPLSPPVWLDAVIPHLDLVIRLMKQRNLLPAPCQSTGQTKPH